MKPEMLQDAIGEIDEWIIEDAHASAGHGKPGPHETTLQDEARDGKPVPYGGFITSPQIPI